MERRLLARSRDHETLGLPGRVDSRTSEDRRDTGTECQSQSKSPSQRKTRDEDLSSEARRAGGSRELEPIGRRAKLDAGVSDVVKPKVRVFRQATAEHLPRPPRCVGRQSVPRRLLVDDVGEDVGHRLPVESFPSRERFEQNASERPDVGAFVDAFSFRLLGAHVGYGAQNHTGTGGVALRA